MCLVSSLKGMDPRLALQSATRLHADGWLEAAVDAYLAILEQHPDTCFCWSNLDAALRTLGRGRRCCARAHASARGLLMLERSDTPWYPTMRLFRQPAPNDWEGLFREVRRELEALLAQPSARRESVEAGA